VEEESEVQSRKSASLTAEKTQSALLLKGKGLPKRPCHAVKGSEEKTEKNGKRGN